MNVLSFVEPILENGKSVHGDIWKIPMRPIALRVKNPTGSNDWVIHSLAQTRESRLAFLKTEDFHANPEISKGQGKPKGSEPVDTSYIWNPILQAELTNP